MKLKRNLSLLIIAFFISTVTYGQSKEDAKTLVKQGIALHNEGKYTEAIEKYRQATNIDPESSDALYEMSFTLFTIGKGKESLPYLEKVLQLNPQAGGAWDMLGSIYDDDNQPDKAIDYYLKGIKVDPDYQRLYYNLAITYYRQGKYPEAEANAIAGIKRDYRHASSQRIYALATYKQNKMGRSLLAWCSFLLIEPQTKRSAEALGYVKRIINNGIKITGEKSVTITIDEKGINSANLLMSTAVLAATSDKKGLSSIDSLTLQLTSLFTIAHDITSDADEPFVAKFYSDYFADLGKSGNMPAFVRFLSISAYPDENKKWITEHDEEFTALSNWATSTKREL